jgi:membrane protease YdiL (CAAX protease family)
VFDGRALPFALGGIALAVITARAVSFFLRQISLPVAAYFLAFWTLVFGGLWITCRYVSRRFGSGNPWSDFGFAWRPSDLWRGAAAYLVAQFLVRLATTPWIGHTGRLERLTEGMRYVSWPAFAVFACSAVVAAPVFEELAFRGMLQRTLASRVGSGRAIAGQSVVFAAYHLVPQLGWDNVPYAVGLISFGLVMGWVAHRLGRLGAGCTAHVIANTLGVIAKAGAP